MQTVNLKIFENLSMEDRKYWKFAKKCKDIWLKPKKYKTVVQILQNLDELLKIKGGGEASEKKNVTLTIFILPQLDHYLKKLELNMTLVVFCL